MTFRHHLVSVFNHQELSDNFLDDSMLIHEKIMVSNFFDLLLRRDYTSRENLTAQVSEECFDEFNREGQQYNVMVFNLEQPFQDKLEGLIHQCVIPYGTMNYCVWVFAEGEFFNQGDGGDINWAFKGWFERNGGHVKFRRP